MCPEGELEVPQETVKTFQHWKRVWDALAQSDPLWTVCTDPTKQNRQWTSKELFETGDMEVETIIAHARSLGLTPETSGRALDFGCGVGRLTQALSKHFVECHGVDISPAMIATAIELAGRNPKCNYRVNDSPHLACFADRFFDFIYSSIVLQHIEPQYVSTYLREFIRVLKPGGILVFQIPDRRKGEWIKRMRERLKLRSRLRSLLASLGVPEGRRRSGWRMYCFSEREIRELFALSPCRIVGVKITNSCEANFNGNLRFYQGEPKVGFVSKQYTILKSAA